MSDLTRGGEEPRTHRVRPRWTWIALVVMIIGLVLIAVGIIVMAWSWAIGGLVVLACGAAAGLYGGFFYDVHSGARLGGELEDAAEGEEYRAPDPHTRRSLHEIEGEPRRRDGR